MHVALSLVVAVAGLVVPGDGPDGPPPPLALLVIDWEAGPSLVYPDTGIKVPLASTQVDAEWCGSCAVVAVGGRIFSAQDGRLVSYERGQPGLRDLGSADEVLATADGEGLYVLRNGRSLVQVSLDTGDAIAGPWTLPAEYELPQPPRATRAGILLVHYTKVDGEIVAWHPRMSALMQLGRIYQLLDAHAATGRVALTDCGAGESACELVIAASDGSARRTVASSIKGLGVYGAAFSPDGGTLALMRSDDLDAADSTAELVLVDVASGRIDVVEGTEFPLAGSFPAATWSPDGTTVYTTRDAGLAAYTPATGTLRRLPYPGVLTAVAVVP